jgi:hypothetical protein
MKDVTDIFKQLISSDINWTHSTFYSIIEALKFGEFNLSFWEGEENWATILTENKVVGYVWKKYPLIVINREISDIIKDKVNDIHNLFCIEVDSLENDTFKIEDVNLHGHFGNFSKFEKFTMEELWFETNCI